MEHRKIHRLHILLDEVEPAIWRRIELASDTEIDFAAHVIRCVFGWSFDHACKFTIKRRDYGTFNDWVRVDPEQEFDEKRRKISKQKLGPRQERAAVEELIRYMESLKKAASDDEDEDEDEDAIPLLSELVPRTGSKFKFVFDFGDWWEHTVRVEKIEPPQPGVKYPRCLDGAGANPLEDCGGPWSLMEIIQALRHPKQPRSETMQSIIEDWVGEGWDFTRFSVEETNQRIRKMFPSAKTAPE